MKILRNSLADISFLTVKGHTLLQSRQIYDEMSYNFIFVNELL
jgi:hypothetical protein